MKDFGMAININIGVFSTTAAALLLMVALPKLESSVVPGEGNIIEFNQDFNGNSTKEATELVKKFNESKGKDERILIRLLSPGGEVMSGRDFQRHLTAGLPVDTYVGVMAASMGADTFMLGERRYVDPDSIILFHGAAQGSIVTTEPVLKRLIEHVEQSAILEPSAQLMDDTTDIQPLIMMIDKMVQENGSYAVLHELRSTYDVLCIINRTMSEKIAAKLQKTDPSWTNERVVKELFGDFKRDMVFTGQQLFDMGVATHLNAPPETDYTSA